MKKTFYLLIILLLPFTLYYCGNQKKNSEVSSPKVIPVVEDTDADGVIDYLEIEPEEVNYEISRSEMIELPSETKIIGNVQPKSTEPQTISVSKYEMGKLVYFIPDEMSKLKTYQVEVRIERNQINLEIYDGIEITVDTIIRTSELMQVELIDPVGDRFRITTNSVKQFIDIFEPTTWKFYVTPLKSGKSPLKVVVSVIKDGNLKQTVYDDEIIVKTTPWLEIKLWLQLYWQWFFMVLILPLGKYLHTKYKKK
jgi:hypothetical protein